MVTIDDVRKVIEDYKLNLYEINNHLDKQDNYINNIIYKTDKVSTALELLKVMTVNHIDKFDSNYYSYPHNYKIIKMDYANILNYYYGLYKGDDIFFIVLDKESPLFMNKVAVKAHLFKKDKPTEHVEFHFSNMHEGDLDYAWLCTKKKDGKYGSFDKAIKYFIQKTIDEKEELNKIRQATDIMNNPIGKQD